jgi:NADH dehydrogenase
MRVVIAGAGFAGLKLARHLNNQKGIEVILLDRFNYHQFQPLFYQVSTAGLDASNISFPLRKMFHKSRNVRIRLTEIESIDTDHQLIETNTEPIEYDILVLATGADTNFFGNKNLEEHALPMKCTTEALRIRHHLIQNFEDALLEKDPEKLKQLMTIVIVGGGPTGVELSGAIAEMKKEVLPCDYPDLDFSKMEVILLEGGEKTLPTMSAKSSADSAEYLRRLGVNVMMKSLVKDYDGEKVTLIDGRLIPAETVIWAAGIKGNVPAGIDKTLLVRGNRIKVDRLNRVTGMNNVYAIGDVAYMETPLYPTGHPQVANVAVGQGKNLATNLVKMSRQEKFFTEYEYKDKGSLATVGRNLAVVDLPKPKIHLNGFFAWFVWMSLHLFLLVGVKNRLQVFINWIYNYFTSDQSLRLIFKEFYTHEAASVHPVNKEQKAV